MFCFNNTRGTTLFIFHIIHIRFTQPNFWSWILKRCMVKWSDCIVLDWTRIFIGVFLFKVCVSWGCSNWKKKTNNICNYAKQVKFHCKRPIPDAPTYPRHAIQFCFQRNTVFLLRFLFLIVLFIFFPQILFCI